MAWVNKMRDNFKPNGRICACGKELTGAKKFSCSARCQDKRYQQKKRENLVII